VKGGQGVRNGYFTWALEPCLNVGISMHHCEMMRNEPVILSGWLTATVESAQFSCVVS